MCIWATDVTRVQLKARLQNSLSVTAPYLQEPNLKVLSFKMAAISFTQRCIDLYSLTINGRKIPFVLEYLCLGGTRDRGLTWTRHINQLKTKVLVFVLSFSIISGTASEGYRPIFPTLVSGTVHWHSVIRSPHI